MHSLTTSHATREDSRSSSFLVPRFTPMLSLK